MPFKLISKSGQLAYYPNIASPDTKLALYYTIRARAILEGGVTDQDICSVCREILGILPSKKWCMRLLAEYQDWSQKVRQYDTLSEWSLYEKKQKKSKGILFDGRYYAID